MNRFFILLFLYYVQFGVIYNIVFQEVVTLWPSRLQRRGCLYIVCICDLNCTLDLYLEELAPH
jgi:hypothetical protein